MLCLSENSLRKERHELKYIWVCNCKQEHFFETFRLQIWMRFMFYISSHWTDFTSGLVSYHFGNLFLLTGTEEKSWILQSVKTGWQCFKTASSVWPLTYPSCQNIGTTKRQLRKNCTGFENSIWTNNQLNSRILQVLPEFFRVRVELCIFIIAVLNFFPLEKCF